MHVDGAIVVWRQVGVVRHATAWYVGMDEEKRSAGYPDLAKKGVADLNGVAATFQEFLCVRGIGASGLPIVNVGSSQSEATAQVLRRHIKEGEIPPSPELLGAVRAFHPDALSAYRATPLEIAAHSQRLAGLIPDQGCIIVGNDPQMSWLTSHLLGGPNKKGFWRYLWPWFRKTQADRSFSLKPGELAWLECENDRDKATLWVFSPTDESTTDQLIDKIKSKMNTARAFGAFLTALLTFAATQAIDAQLSRTFQIVTGTGFTLLAFAVVLYFLSLFRYDELLMPKRFWSSDPPGTGIDSGFIARPPGPDTWVLYQNMIHVWDMLFVPATVWAGIGVTLLLVGLLQPSGWWWLGMGWALLLLATAFVAAEESRLRLGVND